jgi:hypothetical protein
MFRGFSAFVVSAVITLIGTIWLEQELVRYVAPEMIGILVLTFAAIVAAFGIWSNMRWGRVLAVLFFAAAAANIALIERSIHEAYMEYLLLMAWIIISFCYNVLQLGHDASSSLEAYSAHVEPEVTLDNIMPTPKIAARIRKVKAAGKAKRSKKK